MNLKPSTSTSSRSRAPNFTKEEQELLYNVLQPYLNIIESKKTDSVKHGEKQAAWSRVTEAFNANTKYVNRTTENLLLCYRNMKAKIKKQHSTAKMNLSDPRKKEELVNSIEANGTDWNAVSIEMNEPAEVCESGYLELQKEVRKKEILYKKSVMGTGGGPPPPDDDEPLRKLKKIIQLQIDGLFTMYDGDSLLMTQFQESVPDSEVIIPIDIDYESKPEEDLLPSTPTTFKNRVDLLRKKKINST